MIVLYLSYMLPNFPNFIPLGIELNKLYSDATKHLETYSDIDFATLQIWWNLSEKLTICQLNSNLVINYHQPFDESHSGLSLIGKHKVDESIREIFEYLRTRHETIRLVNVPWYCVQNIKDKSKFDLIEELDFNEYILDSDMLVKMDGKNYEQIRKNIRKFIKSTDEKVLELKELNLSLEEVREEVLASIAKWEEASPKNDPDKTEMQAMQKSLTHAESLNIKSLGVYINKELHGIQIYHQTEDKQYFIMHHLKVNYTNPHITDFMAHEMAKKANSEGVPYLNIEMDLGIENLRIHKMSLRPIKFLQKYTVLPKS